MVTIIRTIEMITTRTTIVVITEMVVLLCSEVTSLALIVVYSEVTSLASAVVVSGETVVFVWVCWPVNGVHDIDG